MTKKQPSTIKNSLYSLAAFVWPIALAFFSAPFIVHTLGTENYGLLALVTSVVGFLAFLDFGVAPALVRYTAEFAEKKNFRELNSIFSSALAFYMVIGITGAILLFIFAMFWAPSVVKVSPGNVQTVHIVFSLAAIGFLLNMGLTAFAAIPGSLQRFDITSRVNLTVGTLSTALTVAIVATGGGVTRIVAIGLLTSLAAIFVYRRINQHLLPQLKFYVKGINRESFKKILAFGGYATIATLATTLLMELDKLILSSMLGASAVSYYVLPGNLAVKIHGAVVALTTVIFPLSTTLFIQREHEKLNALYRRATRLVVLFLALVVTPMYILAGPFLLYWLGPDFAQTSAPVMQILLATYSALALTAIPVFLVFGIGKPVYGAIFAVTSAALNIGLLYVLIPTLGLNGAAWAYLIAVLPTAAIFALFVERKIIGFPSFQLYRSLIPQFVAMVILALGAAYLLRPYVSSLISFALVYIGVVALVAATAWVARIIPKEERDYISTYLRRLLPQRQ